MLVRSPSTLLGFLALAGVLALSWVGCAPTIAPGSSGSNGGSGSSGTGSWSGSCFVPNLDGDLDTCDVDPDPGGGYCGDGTVCDSGSNTWQAKCDQEGCSCRYNGEELCACAFDSSPCAGAEDEEDCCVYLNEAGCCPYPWLNHPGCSGTGSSCTLNADCCTYACSDGSCDP